MRARELKLLVYFHPVRPSLSRPMRARELKQPKHLEEYLGHPIAPHAGA